MAQVASTAWENNSGTLLLQLQQWHPWKWQDQDDSQAKQIYQYMVVGVELEKHATCHEMPSQQWEKPDLPEHKTNLVPLGKTGGYLQLRNFTILHYTVSTQD